MNPKHSPSVKLKKKKISYIFSSSKQTRNKHKTKNSTRSHSRQPNINYRTQSIFFQYPIYLRIIPNHNTLFDIGLWQGNLELNDSDFRVLHTSESTGSATHFLVENKAFHKLGIIHSTAKFLHDLDISENDDIGLRRIDYGETKINSERSEETGVLTKDLVVERSGSRLDERLAIRELNEDCHGSEDIDGFESSLM